MYKDTITLFNRKEGDAGDTWYPTVLRNVQLNMDRAAIMAKYGAESADNAVLHVRYSTRKKTENAGLLSSDGYLLKSADGLVLYAMPTARVMPITIKEVGGKQWFSPKEWDALPAHDKAITFTTGTQFDFFWLGDWGSEEPVHDSDYLAYGDFYSYMNQKHDYVFAISSVGGPYSVIPHFEIMGK